MDTQSLRKKQINYLFDHGKAIQDLSEIIKCKSISYLDQSKMDFNEFKKIHDYIDSSFPFIKKYGEKRVINEGSVFYKITGQNESLPALVLMGHLDVVPPIELDKWEYPPFSGAITNGAVYGRGAMDMKHIDAAILNAVDHVLEEKGKPNRTIYICFGHDEETLGGKGQIQIRNELQKRNASLGLVLDEGGTLSNGEAYYAKGNILEIQVMEKGYLDIEVTSKSMGGHSSHPGKATALTNVSQAIATITSHPFEPKLNKPMIAFFKNIKEFVTDEKVKSFIDELDTHPEKLALLLSQDDALSPLVETTIAPTMIESDSKGANVLPRFVKAIINLRLSDSDTIEMATSKIKELCQDIDVTITPLNAINASKISSIDSNEYELLTDLIHDYYDLDAIVPSISVGGTDCCFYNDLCDNCYRFTPIICDDAYYDGVHGVNEHINIDSYLYGISFYIDLIKKYNY